MAQSVGAVALDIVAGKNTLNNVVSDAVSDAQSTANRGASGISNALGKIGGVAKTVGKVTAVGLGVASTAVVALGKSAIGAYANYEQLVGGVETLFKDSADTVIKNASKAYRTAGLSANEYMETVTSFSASLLQSLGGDTVKASEMADMAITDMSDNANKMGTSMEMIQNAYNGFAKQNFTMLDNLKLGYGGTKEEMQRLLEDAEKLSGINYDISSFSDITEAIHVIQTELDITGTTAKEASSTISGSLSMVKSSWTNLVTGMTSDSADFGTLIDEFVNSVSTAGENLIPRVSKVLDGVAKLVTQLAPKIIEKIPEMLTTLLPSVVNGAVALVNAVVGAMPQLIQLIIDTLPQFISGIQSIFEGIVTALPELLQSICSALPTLIPIWIEALVSMITTLASNFSSIIQPIIDNLPEIIMSIVNALMDNLPALIEGCVNLIVALVGAMPQIIMALIQCIPQIIVSIVEALFNAMPILLEGIGTIFGEAWNAIVTVFSVAGDFFSGLFTGIINVVEPIFSTIVNIASNIWGGIKSVFSGVASFFSGIFSGAVNIIQSVFGRIVGFFSGIWSSITGIFSRVGEVVGKAITGVVSKAVNVVLSTACRIINGFISAINGAIGIINKIPGVDISKLSKLDVPQMEQGGVLKKGQVGLLEGNGAEAVVPLEKNTGWLTRIADMLDTRMAGRGALITPPALENVRAGGKGNSQDSQSKIDELIELIKMLLDKDNSDTTIPIYIGNELIDEYILNKNSRQTIRSGGYA